MLFFHAAFFPQFVDPAYPPVPQLAALCLTFLAIAAVLDSSYALLAGRPGGRLRRPATRGLFDRAVGTVLIGLAVWLAAARRG